MPGYRLSPCGKSRPDESIIGKSDIDSHEPGRMELLRLNEACEEGSKITVVSGWDGICP